MKKLTFDTPASAVKFALVPRTKAGGTPVEDTGALPMLTGYAIIWNATSSARFDEETGDTYFARMLPGSVEWSDPTLAIYSHDTKQVLGNSENQTLRVIPDDIGIRVEIDLPRTTYAADVANLVRDGYVKGMSFGMIPQQWQDKSEAGPDGKPVTIREYSSMLVDEVTVTPIPAFIQTSIETLYAKSPNRDEHSLRLESLRLEMI